MIYVFPMPWKLIRKGKIIPAVGTPAVDSIVGTHRYSSEELRRTVFITALGMRLIRGAP